VAWEPAGPQVDRGSRLGLVFVSEPSKPVFVNAVDRRDPQGAVWAKLPLDEARYEPVTDPETDGVPILSYGKRRPCLVITLAAEIAAMGNALVLPISRLTTEIVVDGRSYGRDDFLSQPLTFMHFLPGNERLADGTVDFRWTWRLRRADLYAARNEATLDDETLLELLLRYRDYLYTPPPA